MQAREKALYHFKTKPKMGGDAISEEYMQQLITFIEESVVIYREQNESKNIFRAAQTPAVFLGVAVVCYILSGICSILLPEVFTNFLTLLMTINVIALSMWAYIR